MNDIRGVYFLSTPFLYLESATCYICNGKATLGIVTFKICIVKHECLVVMSCPFCAKFKAEQAVSFTPFNSMKQLDALTPWLKQMIATSDDIPSFIEECNRNKNVALKLVSKSIFKMCMHCKAKKSKFRCSCCHYLRFCSAECAKSEWFKEGSHHKKHCEAIGNSTFVRNVLHVPKTK